MQDRIEQYVASQWHSLRSMSIAEMVYLVSSAAAVGLLVPTFTIEFYWQMFGLAVALLGIGLFRAWLVPLVLLLVMTNLLFAEVPIGQGPDHTVGELGFAITVLLFVAAASRYVVLAGTIVAYYRGSWVTYLVTPVKRIWSRERSPGRAGVVPRRATTFRPWELVSGMVRIVLAVVVAALVLSLVRLNPSAGQITGILPTATRTIELGIVVVIGAYAIYWIVEAVAWQFLTKAEASMFVRGIAVEEHRPDLQRMARQQVKTQKR